MKNLNGNQLCSVELTLTGSNYFTHDIVQLAVIPLNRRLEVDKSKNIFYVDIQQVNGNMDVVSQIGNIVISKDNVASLFNTWFDNLGLKDGKKIMPISYDWAVKRQFLNTIFWEEYNDYFTPTVRDITVGAVLLDDVYFYSSSQYKYQKYFFSFVANMSGNPCYVSEDVITRAIKIPKIYKSLILEMAKLV